MVVRDAHLLCTDALQYLYGLWALFQERERHMPVVLVGTDRIRTILRRPSLASLNSCIFLWHRLTREAQRPDPGGEAGGLSCRMHMKAAGTWIM